MACETPKFNPHYYNLDLPIDAPQQGIKQAYRRLSRMLHPDKIRDPSQKSNAFVAIQLINEAYEVLSDEGKRNQYQLGCNDQNCRRRRDYDIDRKINHWNEKWKKKNVKKSDLKPWFWQYNPIPPELCNGNAEEYFTGPSKRLCTATWVNVIHLLVDNGLPATISDNIWSRAQSWRDGDFNKTRNNVETLDFQRGCDNFQVNITMKETFLPWSELPSNTDWPTLGDVCELFCPDILFLPLAFYVIIVFIHCFLWSKMLRWLTGPSTPAFWPPSAIDSPHSEGNFSEDIMTQSQRESRTSSSRRRNGTTPSEQQCYADEEEPLRKSSDKSAQTQFYTATATLDRSTNPSIGTLELDKSTKSSERARTLRQSTITSEKTSPTQFFSADSQRRPSPIHPSQLLSLASSEKHWYYSDPEKDTIYDLPLRERRRPNEPAESLRTRFVHYEDENFADDERTPRMCVALTATGKPCQRRVSMTSPLTGTTLSGLASPLCFQHRHIRKWIRQNNDQEPPTPGRTLSAGNSPVVGKRKLAGRLLSSR